MSNTLKNLIETIESEGDFEKNLKFRRENIDKFSILGPADLCYLTKTFNRSLVQFSKPTKSGFYHFVYGLNTSSPAAVSAYINSLLQIQEPESTWFSNGKWNITRAVVSIYNPFDKVDINLEIDIPGGIKLYGYNVDGSLQSIDEKIWERAHIASVLRAMEREEINDSLKIHQEFHKPEELTVFLEQISNLIKERDLPYEPWQQLTFGSSRVLYIVNNYLQRKKYFKIAEEFFKQTFRNIDQRHIWFLSDILEKNHYYKHAVMCLAPILHKTPHIVLLLYKQALNFLKLGQLDIALNLGRSVMQIASDSFEVWCLLAEIYLARKDYEKVIMAMNVVPVGSTTEYRNYLSDDTQSLRKTNPKVILENDVTSMLFFEMKRPDFKSTKSSKFIEEATTDQLDDNQKEFEFLENLPGRKLVDQELTLYKLLLKLEKELGWEKLLTVRVVVFIMENEQIQGQNIPTGQSPSNTGKSKVIEDYEIYNEENKPNEEDINITPFNDQSFMGVKASGDNIVKIRKEKNKKKGADGIKLSNNNNAESDGSNSEEEQELPSFIKQENENIFQAAGEGKKEVHSDSNLDKHLNYGSEKNGLDSDDNKFGVTRGTRSDSMSEDIYSEASGKRHCSKLMDSIFLALFEDLSAFYQWQNEEQEFIKVFSNEKSNKMKLMENPDLIEEIIKDRCNGTVWIARGILAERLDRKRIAEQAYRFAILQGFSIYAWQRLTHLYLEAQNYKAVIACIAEVLEEMDDQGVRLSNNSVPVWIEDSVIEIIHKVGEYWLQEYMKEINFINKSVDKIIKEAARWGVTGPGKK